MRTSTFSVSSTVLGFAAPLAAPLAALLALVAALLVLLASGAALAQPAWQKVAASDGSFAAEFPDAPVPDTQVFRGEKGAVTVNSYRVAAENAHWAAGTIVHERADERDAVRMLDDARDGVLARSGGTLVAERILPTGNAPGRELVYAVREGDATFQVRQRFYVAAPGRLVQIAYVGAPGTEGGPAAMRFLDSLEFGDR